MRPISRWWKYLFSRVSAACGALTPCSPTFMDEAPRKSGGAEVRGEYVMKSTRSEETRMSVLDDYLVDPKISMLAKSLTRSGGKDCSIPIQGSISVQTHAKEPHPHCWRRTGRANRRPRARPPQAAGPRPWRPAV